MSLFFEQLFWTIKCFLSRFSNRHLNSTFFINISHTLIRLFLLIILCIRDLSRFLFIYIVYVSLIHLYIFIIILGFMAPIPPKKIFIRMSCINIGRFCHCSTFLYSLFLCVFLCSILCSSFINFSLLYSWFWNLISNLFALIFYIIFIYLIGFLNCLIINIYFFILIK